MLKQYAVKKDLIVDRIAATLSLLTQTGNYQPVTLNVFSEDVSLHRPTVGG